MAGDAVSSKRNEDTLRNEPAVAIPYDGASE